MMFSISVVSTKKRYFSFLKKFFVFSKIYFKVKVLKPFETFTDCHIKACWSLKRRAILKIPSTVFRRTYALICTIIQLKELNWLCKHMKNGRISQPSISMIFCNESRMISCTESSSSMWVSLKLKFISLKVFCLFT